MLALTVVAASFVVRTNSVVVAVVLAFLAEGLTLVFLIQVLLQSKTTLNVSYAENVRQAYTKARNKVKSMILKSKREFERNIGIQSKSNPKIFWSHVRSKLKTKTGVALLSQDKKGETLIQVLLIQVTFLLSTIFKYTMVSGP